MSEESYPGKTACSVNGTMKSSCSIRYPQSDLSKLWRLFQRESSACWISAGRATSVSERPLP